MHLTARCPERLTTARNAGLQAAAPSIRLLAQERRDLEVVHAAAA